MLRVTSRPTVLWLGALVVIGSTGCVPSAQSQQTIVLKPGDNLEAIVAHAPEGTVFRFEPGTYRQQTIRPKNRQKFIGQDGVILSGAMVLESWTRESGLWKHDALPEPLDFRGECADGTDLCGHREDLFLNGQLYRRVESLDELGPRRWYYEDRSAYLADDPSGQLVELGVTPRAFGGDAEEVVLKKLVVEKYASNAQEGAIFADDARGWRIVDVTVHWNHGAGLSFGPETRVIRGLFSHNGQIGMVASGGEGSRVIGVEIAFNNYAGYEAGWEAGGTKFWDTTGLVVRNSCVHHNEGKGLWTDFDNIDTVYEGNIVFSNANDGIKHEISYDAIIRDNIVADNGYGYDNWLWGSQILVQNSSKVKVYGNLVEVSPDFGNGVSIVHQDRGEGAYGPWHAVHNEVHDNTIIHLGSHGQDGVAMDTDDDWFWSEADNRFDRNTYVVADREVEHWTSNDRDAVWKDIEDIGLDRNSELIVEQRAPMELSCDR
jgi:parallel beta-helix repeat protein